MQYFDYAMQVEQGHNGVQKQFCMLVVEIEMIDHLHTTACSGLRM